MDGVVNCWTLEFVRVEKASEMKKLNDELIEASYEQSRELRGRGDRVKGRCHSKRR